MRKISVPVPSGLDDVLVGSVAGEAGARQAGWVVDRIVDLERQKAAIEAAQVRELALLADVYAGTTAEPYVATEVSLALGVAPSVARARVEVARELCGRFTATLAALEAGRIDGFKARVIVEALTGVEEVGTAQRIEAELLKGVDGRSVTQIRRSLAGLVMRFDPAGAKARRDSAAADRRVQVTPLGDGIGELWACGPVEGVAVFHTALDALARTARRNPAEDRTLDQLRFDLLGVIGSGILAAGTLSGLAALATGEQHTDCRAGGSGRGWGGGPASAAAKERMSATHAGPPPGASPAPSPARGSAAALPGPPGGWQRVGPASGPAGAGRWGAAGCGPAGGWSVGPVSVTGILSLAGTDGGPTDPPIASPTGGLRPGPHRAVGDRRGDRRGQPGGVVPPPPPGQAGRLHPRPGHPGRLLLDHPRRQDLHDRTPGHRTPEPTPPRP